MPPRRAVWKPASKLAIAGGLAFWIANFAISLTPIAAEYRDALAIAYVPMLVQAAAGGLVIGFCVGYCMLRFPPRIPLVAPMSRSLALSLVALIVVTLVIEVPAKFNSTLSDPWRYFAIGSLFNAVRILALGVAIGLVYDTLTRSRGSKGAAVA